MNKSIYAIGIPVILSLMSNRVGSSSKTLAEYENIIEDWKKSRLGSKGLPLRLKEVDLSGQNLESIPDFVFDLPRLETLILNNNQISVIPDDILKITSLEKLELDNNNISKMPESFEKLKSLRWLFLRNNNLKTIPINYSLPNSIAIIATGNPDLIIPKELAFPRKYRVIKADWDDVTFDIDNPYRRLFAKRTAIYSDVNTTRLEGRREQYYRKMADNILKPVSELRKF